MSYSRNDELILLVKERYALGRRTDFASPVAVSIWLCVPELSDWCLGVLAQDYRDRLAESERSHGLFGFGDDCDKRAWDALYAAVTQEIERRKQLLRYADRAD